MNSHLAEAPQLFFLSNIYFKNCSPKRLSKNAVMSLSWLWSWHLSDAHQHTDRKQEPFSQPWFNRRKFLSRVGSSIITKIEPLHFSPLHQKPEHSLVTKPGVFTASSCLSDINATKAMQKSYIGPYKSAHVPTIIDGVTGSQFAQKLLLLEKKNLNLQTDHL